MSPAEERLPDGCRGPGGPEAATTGPGAIRVSDRSSGALEWLEVAGEGWAAAFSTRRGGTSSGSYASLNLGLSVGDAAANVARNRATFAAALGFTVADLVVPGQVHGTRVTRVGESERGRGAFTRDSVIADSDGLLTSVPRLPLLISFADCVPVVLAGRTSGGDHAVAVIHAGWRGLLAGVLGVGFDALRRSGHVPVAGVVGPSIGPCCFSVSAEVGEAFARRFPGTYAEGCVDLWAAAERELAAGGLLPAAAHNLRLCTSCDEGRFFSHRRDRGATGRQVALAWVTD